MNPDQKVITYRGRLLSDMTKEELIEAIEIQHIFYERMMESKQSVIEMYSLANANRGKRC